MSGETQQGRGVPGGRGGGPAWSGGARARDGASLTAPTAPHATPPEPGGGKRTQSGPERFWSRRRVRVAFAAAIVLSLTVHYIASPWSFLPNGGLELKDTDGELTIPIEMLEGNEAPPAPPPPPPPPPDEAQKVAAEGPGHAAAVDAGTPKPKRDRDAGVGADAEADAESTADSGRAKSIASLTDGGAADAAGGAIAATSDAGLNDGIMAGPTLVEIRVSIAVVRKNPVGARMGPLLLGIPQWADFLGGTDVDPVKDLDWIWIFGPSLLHTEKDAAILHYNMTDDRAAKDIAVLSRRDVGGGKLDVGVPGVKAWRGRADKAWRVFMLPRPHLAAMVPPDFAKVAAKAFSRTELRSPTGPNEAVRVMVKNPSHPMPFLPTSLTELRFWATPREGGGAEAFVEADATDAAAAVQAAKQVRQLIAQQNSIGVRIVTRGILNDFEVTSEGAMVKGHLPVSQEQLEAMYDLVAAFLGVPATPGAASGAPSGGTAPGRGP